jgi:hypothetical protein
MRRLLFVAIAALLVAAGPAVAGPSVVVRPVPGTHLRIGVPATWKSIDRAQALALEQRVASLNPQIAPLVQAIGGNGSIIKLVTYDPRLRAGFATNANVVAQPSPSASLSSVVAQELPFVRQVLHPTSLTQKAVRAAGRAAVEVSFVARLNEPAGPTDVAETQIYVIDRGMLYVVTLTTTRAAGAAYTATFAAIIQSISFG